MKRKILLIVAIVVLILALDTPISTYADPNPGMVFATYGDGQELTYDGYRLFIDVSEQIERYNARVNLAMGLMLEKDLLAQGVAIDETSYRATVSQGILSSLSGATETALGNLLEATGLDRSALLSAMFELQRSDYYADLMWNHLLEKAGEQYQPPDEAQGLSAEEAEAIRMQTLYAVTNAELQSYYDQFETRCDLSNPDIAVRLDGEEIPYQPVHLYYLQYRGGGARTDLLSSLLSYAIIEAELTKNARPIDDEGFAQQFGDYRSAVLGDPTSVELLDGMLLPYNATREDFFASAERYFRMQQVIPAFLDMIAEEYALLPEGPDKPATEEAYYYRRIGEISEGAALLNLNGG